MKTSGEEHSDDERSGDVASPTDLADAATSAAPSWARPAITRFALIVAMSLLATGAIVVASWAAAWAADVATLGDRLTALEQRQAIDDERWKNVEGYLQRLDVQAERMLDLLLQRQ